MSFSADPTKQLQEALKQDSEPVQRENAPYFAIGSNVDSGLGELSKPQRKERYDLAVEFLVSSAAIQLSNFKHDSMEPENIIEVRQN